MTGTTGTKRGRSAERLPYPQRPRIGPSRQISPDAATGSTASSSVGITSCQRASRPSLRDLNTGVMALAPVTGPGGGASGRRMQDGPLPPRAVPLRPHPASPLPAPSPHLSWDVLVRLAEVGTLEHASVPTNLGRTRTLALAMAAAATARVACAQNLLTRCLDAEPLHCLKLALAACWGHQADAALQLAEGMDVSGQKPVPGHLLREYHSQTVGMALAGNVHALRAACGLTRLRDGCANHFAFLIHLTEAAIYTDNRGLLDQLLTDPRPIVGATPPDSLAAVTDRSQVLSLMQFAARTMQGVAFTQIMNARAADHAGRQSFFNEALGQHVSAVQPTGAPIASSPGYLTLLSWNNQSRMHQLLRLAKSRAAANTLWALCRGQPAPVQAEDVLGAMRHFDMAWRGDNWDAGRRGADWARMELERYRSVLSVALDTAVGCRQNAVVRALLDWVATCPPPVLANVLAQTKAKALAGGMLALAERIGQTEPTAGPGRETRGT